VVNKGKLAVKTEQKWKVSPFFGFLQVSRRKGGVCRECLLCLLAGESFSDDDQPRRPFIPHIFLSHSITILSQNNEKNRALSELFLKWNELCLSTICTMDSPSTPRKSHASCCKLSFLRGVLGTQLSSLKARESPIFAFSIRYSLRPLMLMVWTWYSSSDGGRSESESTS
jgi:hypothetical protein